MVMWKWGFRKILWGQKGLNETERRGVEEREDGEDGKRGYGDR